MQRPPHPLPILRKRTEVQVFMGAGWAKGKVTDSNRNRCSVWLSQGQKTVVVSDARNIREL